MTEHLLRVTAPHFVAGAIWCGGRCVKAAPILGWMHGKDASGVKEFMQRMGWEWQWIGGGH